MSNSKIAILSTVINFDLYAKSSQFFPENIQKYVIDGRNGMHGLHSIFYMMKKLQNKGIEWLIMADEDVLFQNSSVVFDIINRMEAEGHTICGVRDGGVISHRFYNPNLINTFFSIINFKEIESIWSSKELLRNNYVVENEFEDDLTQLKGKYDSNSLFEPYYIFYLWLRRKKKRFLFLDAQMDEDDITNSVLYNDQVFLYHTWYARAYGNNTKHTERINKIFGRLDFEEKKISDPIIYRHPSFFLIQKIKKNCQKVIMKFKN